MEKLLADEKFSFVSEQDKAFIVAFDAAMLAAGYENNGIQPYVVFGRHKIEYSKAGLKTKKYVARIYLRDDGIALRLYFTDVDRHRGTIEGAPDFIKAPFVNDRGRCKQCDQNGGGIGRKGKCAFKKTYTIDGVLHEKCAGDNYFFNSHDIGNVPRYIDLLAAFYPGRKH